MREKNDFNSLLVYVAPIDPHVNFARYVFPLFLKDRFTSLI